MGANLYCDRSDVTKRLPLGAIASASGVIASTQAGANTLTFDGHGLETGDAIVMRALDGGTMPAPLISGTRYYANRVSNSEFEVAATPGGAAIDITTAASSVAITREPDFDEAIEFYSRWADGFFPAHIVPFEPPIHALVRGLVADLAAKRIMNVGGQDSAVINSVELAAKAQLERYAAGLVLRGSPSVTSNANLAVVSSLPSVGDPRGWGTGGTLP